MHPNLALELEHARGVLFFEEEVRDLVVVEGRRVNAVDAEDGVARLHQPHHVARLLDALHLVPVARAARPRGRAAALAGLREAAKLDPKSREVREAMGLMAVENLRAFFAGEALPNPVT